MIDGVDNVYYYVQDIKKAIPFYSEILGLKVLDQDEYWASIQVGTLRLGLHVTDVKDKKAEVEKSKGATLTFSVDDIDKAYDHFKKLGVKFTTDISRNPWGSHVAFEDLDGNHLELRQGPK